MTTVVASTTSKNKVVSPLCLPIHAIHTSYAAYCCRYSFNQTLQPT